MFTGVRKTRRCQARLPASLSLFGVLLSAMGCHSPPAVPADVAVTISGEMIYYRQFEASLQDQTDRETPPYEDDVQSRLFDQFVDGQLLIRLAIERGMEVDDTVESGLLGEAPSVDLGGGERPFDGDTDSTGSLERQAIRFLLRGSDDPAENSEAIAAYYQAHRDEFQRPEEVRLRQILVPERSQAEAALEALGRGEDFALVAARLSQGPNARQGGEQGRLAAADLPPDFREVIFSLEAGEHSEIVEAYYGFLIFQVVERFPAHQAPLEEIGGEIRRTLRRLHVDGQVRTFILEARARYNVEIFPENFPFQYQGAYAKPSN